MALLLLGMFLVLLLGSIILGTNLSHPSLVIARLFPKAPSLLQALQTPPTTSFGISVTHFIV